MVAGVRDVKVLTGGIEAKRSWERERGGQGRSAIAGEGSFAVSCDRADDVGDRVDAADAMIGGVGEEQIAAGVEDDALR